MLGNLLFVWLWVLTVMDLHTTNWSMNTSVHNLLYFKMYIYFVNVFQCCWLNSIMHFSYILYYVLLWLRLWFSIFFFFFSMMVLLFFHTLDNSAYASLNPLQSLNIGFFFYIKPESSTGQCSARALRAYCIIFQLFKH